MANVFLCSDHHFYHKNILTFTRSDNGELLRVFDDVNHMNEYMVMQHNRIVGPKDKVYFLGDVGLGKSRTGFEILGRMHGEKILVKGNHDLAPASVYMEYFKDIRSCCQLDGMLLTHIPVHPESLGRWPINVHGHLHSNRVMIRGFAGKPIEVDEHYQNVSMEQLEDYTPISLEEMNSKLKYLGLK